MTRARTIRTRTTRTRAGTTRTRTRPLRFGGLTAALVTASLVTSATTGMAGASGPAFPADSGVVAEATRAGEHEVRAELDVLLAPSSRGVLATNVAVAHSVCDGCRAVAVSLQVVLAMGEGPVLDARNLAVAVNEGCTSCESLAAAHQVVVLVSRTTRLAHEARAAVHDLRDRLEDLAESGIGLSDMQTQVDALAAELAATVLGGLEDRAAWSRRDRTDVDADEPGADGGR